MNFLFPQGTRLEQGCGYQQFQLSTTGYFCAPVLASSPLMHLGGQQRAWPPGLGEEDRDYGFWNGGPEGRNRGRMGHSKTLCSTSKETCCRSSQHRNHIKGMCQPVTFFSVVHQSHDSPDALAFWTEYVVREKWRNFCAI